MIGWEAWTGAAGAAAGAAEAAGVDAAAASVMAGGGVVEDWITGWDDAIGAAAPEFRPWVRPRESSAAAPAGCEGVSGVDGVAVVGKFVDGMDGEAGVESPLIGFAAVGALDVGDLEDGIPVSEGVLTAGGSGCTGCCTEPTVLPTGSSPDNEGWGVVEVSSNLCDEPFVR